MYLSWSAFYEGRSDALYFNVLVPRLIEDILLREGIRPCDVGTTPAVEFGQASRDFENTAQEICERKEEFHILFIHSDLGGRNLQGTISQRREALLMAWMPLPTASQCVTMMSVEAITEGRSIHV